MNISKRVVVSTLISAITFFVGMLFWPFILSEIIKPSALVVWILLRILVLSVDQKFFWGAIVFLVLIFLFRLLPKEQAVDQTDTYTERTVTIRTVAYWRLLFTFNGLNVREEKSLKRELLHLLTALYTSKQRTSASFVVNDALRKGEIPLPKHIYTFLFPEEPKKSRWVIQRFFQSIQKSVRTSIRQWTGEDKAEHRQMIDEVLSFMETTLEIKK